MGKVKNPTDEDWNNVLFSLVANEVNKYNNMYTFRSLFEYIFFKILIFKFVYIVAIIGYI